MTDNQKMTQIKINLTPQEAAEVDAAIARDGFKNRASWAYWVAISHARRVVLRAQDNGL